MQQTLSATLLLVCFSYAGAMFDYSQPGPMKVGWRKLLVKPPSGLEFDALVVYPSMQVGWEAPMDGSGAPYPLVVFGHGYSTDPDAYMSTLQHLCSWGFIVVAPEAPAMHHLRFANEMSTTITHMEKELHKSNGQFFNQVDMDHISMIGHTVGAGCCILAASKDPRVRALVLLAPLDTMPSAITAVKHAKIPINFIVAKDDWLASADKNAVPIYKAALAPKQLHVITGGGNAYFYDGEGLHRQRQLRIVRHLTTSFLALYQRKDERAWPSVWGADMLNNTKVWSVADRGLPSKLIQQEPTKYAVEELEEYSTVGVNPQDAKKKGEFPTPGPFHVGNTNVTRLTKTKKLFSAVIWYPATKEGIDTPISTASGKFPVVVFGHGWFQLPDNYVTTLANIASYGYIVVGSRASQEMYTDKYAEALSHCIDFVVDQNAINGSRWFGLVETSQVGMVGHSVGGGATILAAEKDLRVKALGLLAPTETMPSAVTAAGHVHVPMLFLSADDDAIANHEKNSFPMYLAARPPKQFHLLHNGSNTFFPDGMLLGKRHRGMIKTTAEMLRDWFDLYLKGHRPGYSEKWKSVWTHTALHPKHQDVHYNVGFSLSVLNANKSGLVAKDGQCIFELLINNTGLPRSTWLMHVQENTWQVTIPAHTPALQKDDAWVIKVKVQVPKDTKALKDSLSVSACLDKDAGTHSAVSLTCFKRKDAMPVSVEYKSSEDPIAPPPPAAAKSSGSHKSGGGHRHHSNQHKH